MTCTAFASVISAACRVFACFACRQLDLQQEPGPYTGGPGHPSTGLDWTMKELSTSQPAVSNARVPLYAPHTFCAARCCSAWHPYRHGAPVFLEWHRSVEGSSQNQISWARTLNI